ncbi:hypothetical protein N8645_00700 [bacterium]|nr:hypothetical protein [bacterium]
MPEYRTYAGLDDRIAKDGDVGFVGFNNRMRPDQLPAGLLADAQNLRTDRRGEAQVRKGIELISNPLSIGESALTLPFTLVADDTSVTATQTGGAVILTNVTATNFPSTGTVNVSGVSGLTPAVNGDRAFTKNSSSQITIADQAYSGTASGTATVKFGILNDGAVNAIYGSCSFSDPNASASQYIIFASNSKGVAVNIATGATTDLAYPTGLTISSAGSMLQAFNKVFIFRDGETALEWNGSFSGTPAFTRVASGTYTQPVSIFSSVKDFSIINSVGSLHTSQSFNIGNLLSLNDDGLTASCGLKVPSTFLVKESFSSNSSVAVTGVAVSGTTITVTTGASHGLSLNQTITFAALDAGLNGNNSVSKVNSTTEFEVEVATTFTASDVTGTVTPAAGISFIISSESITSEKTQAEVRASNPVFIKQVSVGLGFSHMPAPPYATYHQRRLVMPFKFSVDASTDSFTSRGILDEVIASDILDTDTYDQIYAQYRFNAGEADFNVGLHSFSEDNLMVFNRNSIHLITNTTSLQAASTKLLTNEVGCVARKSITQVGNQVIFLSDNGVYSTQFFDEYNLRGTDTPLSEPINVTIQRINKAHWDKSVAAYFDNRYFLAVPLDNSTNNNAIIIYNFLNKQWESIDQVNDTDFHVSNLLVVGEGDARGVYAVNDLGGVQKLDERVDGVDRVITQIGGSQKNINVPGSLTTRQYTLGSLERKNWKQFEMHVESGASTVSNFNISAETENPDFNIPVGTLSDFVGSTLSEAEDVSIRGRIGNRRGYGIQFTINNTVGRPKIRAIEADGSISFRSTNKAE